MSTRLYLRVVEAKVAADEPGWNTDDPDVAARDQLEAALAAVLADLAAKWVDRAVTRAESPKSRKGTRHWLPEYEQDNRVGTKALDTTRAVPADQWQAEAQEQASPLVKDAAIAAALALYLGLKNDDDEAPSAAVIATIVAATVAGVLLMIAKSAARQAMLLAGIITGLDDSGADMPAIRAAVLAHHPAMQEWAKGVAIQGATATVEGARDEAAEALAQAHGGSTSDPDPDIVRRWRSRRDEKVRPSHVKAEGQERPIGAPFVVGGALLRFPGDPRAPFRETANCRCHLQWRSKRSGQFAPKTPGEKSLGLVETKDTHTGTVTVSVGGRSYTWKPNDHPRDRHGKFISRGGEVLTAGGDLAHVDNVLDANHIEVTTAAGDTSVVDRHSVEVTKASDGGAPHADVSKVGAEVAHDPTHPPMPSHLDPAAPDTHAAPAPEPLTWGRHSDGLLSSDGNYYIERRVTGDRLYARDDNGDEIDNGPFKRGRLVHTGPVSALRQAAEGDRQSAPSPDAPSPDAPAETLAVSASHGYSTGPSHPQTASFSSPQYATEAEAAAFVAKYPKSAGFRVSRVSHLDGPDTYTATTSTIRLYGSDANGGINEAGQRRIAQILRTADANGHPVTFPAEGVGAVNSYRDRAAFERHVLGQSTPPATPAPVDAPAAPYDPAIGRAVTIRHELSTPVANWDAERQTIVGAIGQAGLSADDVRGLTVDVTNHPPNGRTGGYDRSKDTVYVTPGAAQDGYSLLHELGHRDSAQTGQDHAAYDTPERVQSEEAYADRYAAEHGADMTAEAATAQAEGHMIESGREPATPAPDLKPLGWRRHQAGLISDDGNYLIQRGANGPGQLYRRATAAEHEDDHTVQELLSPDFQYGKPIGNDTMSALRQYAEDDRRENPPWTPKLLDQGPTHRQIVDPQRLNRVLFDIKREDGVWGVYPPTNQSPAVAFGSYPEALKWATTYAHLQRDGEELPDAEGNFYDDTTAPDLPTTAVPDGLVPSTATARRALDQELTAQGLPPSAPLRAVLTNGGSTHLAVARDPQGRVVGGVAADVVGSGAGRSVHLTGMRVNDERQGYGQQLVAALAREVGDNGDLQVYGALDSAKPFYAKTGASFRPDSAFGQWSPESVSAMKRGEVPPPGEVVGREEYNRRNYQDLYRQYPDWAREQAANNPAFAAAIAEADADTEREAGVHSPQQDGGTGDGSLRDAGAGGVGEERPGSVPSTAQPDAVLPGPGNGGAAPDRLVGGRAADAAGGDVRPAGDAPQDGAVDGGVDGAGGDAPGAAAAGGNADDGLGAADAGGDAGGPGATGGLDGLPGRADGVAADDAGGDAGAGDGADAGLAHTSGLTEADQPAADPEAMPTVAGGDTFRPSSMDDLAPAGKVAKLNANMAALRTLRQLQGEGRPATPEEQAVLARWAGWGGLPEVFDPTKPQFAAQRAELGTLMSQSEIHEAQRNTLNAHYTDAHVVASIWHAVDELGFDGGRVLEPGSGSGTFIGFAPDKAAMVGVELDSTTAAISQFLYPDAVIRNESFAATNVPDGSFDATVGNVPFGDFALTDRRHNPAGESIHNHFILKSLALTRPGGVVAVLTSRYTLDTQSSRARQAMADKADLIGAVRLPSGSHQRASGTGVIEDILIFRVREPGAEPQADQTWVNSSKRDINGFPLSVNDYWAEHPGNVLGQMTAEKGQYGTGDIIVRGDREMPDLPNVLDGIVAQAKAEGLTATPSSGEPLPELIGPDTTRHEGHIRAEDNGTFTQAIGGASVPVEVPAKQAPELRGLIGLRDALSTLLTAEAATGENTPQIAALRADLNDQYDAYVAKFGPINRFGITKSGARQRPAQGGFRSDPMSAVVRALEDFDPVSQTATKSDVFTKRAVAPREIRTTADTPQDALALSMEMHGRVDLPTIAALLGTDEASARANLGTLVFEQPPLTPEEQANAEAALSAERLGDMGAAEAVDLSTVGESVRTEGELDTAAAYLSGNVRRKLAAARAAAAVDPRFQANVDALQAVIPADLGPAEIDGRLGAAWIDQDTVAAFLREILNARYTNAVQVSHSGGSIWTVIGPKHGSLATEQWGTPDRPAPELVQALLEQRPIRVTRKDPDSDRSIPDLDATLAAQAKAEELQERFAEWIWEDPDRARRLQTRYNDQFNAIVLRQYTGTPGREFPGMSPEFTPHDHVKAAAERIVQEPTVLLAHVVGAGKTAEMVMGTQELKRLGLARKPAVVIPNHMLEQFSREYLEIYPQAKILAAGTDDLRGDKRREFVARAATGDWDTVILTQSAFESIPMSSEQVQAYIDREMATLRRQLEEAQASDRNDKAQQRTVKKMEKALVRAEEALKKKLGKDKDVGVSFEQTGIDYLMVDEAHMYSNLRTLSNIQSAGSDGSDRATDLHMKMEYLRANSESGRVATFATGTPIRNTVTQAYVMQRFLRPDLLEDAGIHSFDQWAATFGQVVEEMELKPEGSGFRQSSRFARFRNVPELLRLFHTFADVKMAEDLNLDTPNLIGGKAETVAVPASDTLREYVRELGTRADAVRGGQIAPEDDNMLKISTDGRKAALSMRLVGEDHEPGKIEAAADRISSIYDTNKDRTYGDDERPGALQIVFLDMGTPKDTRGRAPSADDTDTGSWNAYDTLRDELIERGVPADQIAYIHQAKNDAQKAEMFAAARNGRISVIIGSSEKMGVGTNIQKRAVALHHLDAPWRPADVEQRDGRIMRHGNANPDVEVIRYVTEGSFDAYMWQTLERKAKFINQVMRGSLDVREIEDIGDTAMNYAEIKALATGNPDLLSKAKADTALTKLERLERAFRRSQTNMASEIGRLQGNIPAWTADADALDRAIAQRVDTRGEAFAATIGDERFTKRADAAPALVTALRGVLQRDWGAGPERVIGSLGGHDVTAQSTYRRATGERVLSVGFAGVPGEVMSLNGTTLREFEESGGTGLVSRLENGLEAFEQRRDRLRTAATEGAEEIDRMQGRSGGAFPRAAELALTRKKARRLAEKMDRDAKRADGQAIPFDPTIDSDQYDEVHTEDMPPPDANLAPSMDPPGAPTVSEAAPPSREEQVAAMQALAIANAGLDPARWSVSGNHFASTIQQVAVGDAIYTEGRGDEASPVELPIRVGSLGLPSYANVQRVVSRIERHPGGQYTLHFTDGTSTGPDGGDRSGVTYVGNDAVYAVPRQLRTVPETTTTPEATPTDSAVRQTVETLPDGSTLVLDPDRVSSADGYASNMRWAVIGPDGVERARGPEWRMRLLATREAPAPAPGPDAAPAPLLTFPTGARVIVQHEGHPSDGLAVTVTGGVPGDATVNAVTDLGDDVRLSRYTQVVPAPEPAGLTAPADLTFTDPFDIATAEIRNALPAGTEWRNALNDVLKVARRHHEGGDPVEALNLIDRARSAHLGKTEVTDPTQAPVQAALSDLRRRLVDANGDGPEVGSPEWHLQEASPEFADEISRFREQLGSADSRTIDATWGDEGGLGDAFDDLIDHTSNFPRSSALRELRDSLDAQVAVMGNGTAPDAEHRETRREITVMPDENLRALADRTDDPAEQALIQAEYAKRGLDDLGFARVYEDAPLDWGDRLLDAAEDNADITLANSGDTAAIRARLVELGVTIYPSEPSPDQIALPIKRWSFSARPLEQKAVPGGAVHVRVGGRSYLWKPEQHPRDDHGKFISQGGEVRTAAGDLAKVTNIVDANHVEVQKSDGGKEVLDRHDVTVTKAPDGAKPTSRVEHVADEHKPVAPATGDRSIVQHRDGWTGTVTGGHGANVDIERHDNGKTETAHATDLFHVGHEVTAPAAGPPEPGAATGGHDARRATPPTGDTASMDDYSLIAGLNGAPTPDVQAKLDAELTDRASKQATALLGRITPVEATTTPLLHGIADDLGMKMRGLGEDGDGDFRFKTHASLSRKIKTKSLEKVKPTDRVAGGINDALRYTMQADTEDFAPHVQAVLDRLKVEGYTIKEADNSWVEGNTYKGINSTIVAPDGTEFELQFHTPESFVLKDGDLHKHYEAMRDPSLPYAERMAAYRECVRLSAELPTPPGVESVGNRKEYGEPIDTQAKPAKSPKVLDVPATNFGMTYHPSDASDPAVLVGKTWGGWDDLPTTEIAMNTPLRATEEMLASSSIDKVVSGAVPVREGYDPHVLITEDGRAIVVDGHHRVAIHGGMGHEMVDAKVYDERSMGPIGRINDVPKEVQDRLDKIKSEGRPDGSGAEDDPIAVGDDIDRAVALLAEGKHVRLAQPEQVATLLDRLAAESERVIAAGGDAPTFDLCKVSVPGTNLFCADHRDIDRLAMPQFSGIALPGSPASKIANAKGKANVSAAFREELKRRGISVTARTMPASHLRASQRELNGTVVAGMTQAIEAGDFPESPIFVTREGYVIDGHHRWAANIVADIRDGRLGDSEMPVEMVDLDVGAALDFANAFTEAMGIPHKGVETQVTNPLPDDTPNGAPSDIGLVDRAAQQATEDGFTDTTTAAEPVVAAGDGQRAAEILGSVATRAVLGGTDIAEATPAQVRRLTAAANALTAKR